MERSNKTKLVNKQRQDIQEKDKEQNRFTDKKRKNKEAKIQNLGGFQLDKNLFQQAKDAIANLTNMQTETKADDQQAAQNAIDAAYENASPEEQQQLQQLEQKLKQKNQLK